MIALGSDHGGYDLKEVVKEHLQKRGFEVKDFGTYSKESCDYPDFGRAAAEAVASGECEKGIVICTTGIGISIVANKVKGIRCALCSETTSARLTREHNDANMLAMGGGLVGNLLALEIVDTFLDTEFSEMEKHSRRISKIEE
ncbi:MAG: ribose 5-phosphate isomerase B [Butyrivibrio sp.]|jgi:ribose 5-phosphate isomerase B|uniref:Ribose 5-phosphate isomerase B n=1 Tax=Butyrivibrio hungatei TaxID=185008 RepID=A0A1G5CK13_9FIRM|nr:ribose 5-phosphate isomerase B [Butyrivibrio hungatei]MBQ2610027.1 ribose 5-phosphate isomerase B [Butyrivibrio sp.]MBQ4219532.1 ribose 5-phosphate isomerase B [Butyrivibrio sp.]MBR4358129.1 ribose 5-phosphate isomerase B [Butyrivibrio sp.]MBR4639848.1 ribose 5-phosphate isomerase B [Butyrivibrio sp.]MEE3470976.1 ribose 5-phosphate isomerase B [Butyrivibrio hungatei]